MYEFIAEKAMGWLATPELVGVGDWEHISEGSVLPQATFLWFVLAGLPGP